MSEFVDKSSRLATCPACRGAIMANLRIELEDNAVHVDNDGGVSMQGKIVGAAIQHDCRPKTHRQLANRSQLEDLGG